MRSFIISFGIAICCAVALGEDAVVEMPSDDCSPEAGSEASRMFAYEMYKTTVRLNQNKNIFLAPTTVGSGLSMLLPGARERTEEQMWRGLMFKNTSKAFERSDVSCLMKMYSNELLEAKKEDRSKASKTTEPMAESLQLRTANKIFGEDSFVFNSDFIEETANYGAEMSKLDFRRNATESRKIINEWVEEVTEGKIKDLFGDDAISADTVLAVVSAIYFKGSWKYQFDEDSTFNGTFRVNAKKEVQVEFMAKNSKYPLTYSEELGARLLEVPYKGDEYGRYNASMILILPEESMEKTERMLSEKTIKPKIEELKKPKGYMPRVQLIMPKFKMSLTYQLKPILRKLGIKNLFNPTRADLTGMVDESQSTPNLYVSTAVHKTFIEVDEKGTEAAGATGFEVVPLSLPPQFRCDRPFLFMIYEKNTDGVLFIGKVNDPSTEK